MQFVQLSVLTALALGATAQYLAPFPGFSLGRFISAQQTEQAGVESQNQHAQAEEDNQGFRICQPVGHRIYSLRSCPRKRASRNTVLDSRTLTGIFDFRGSDILYPFFAAQRVKLAAWRLACQLQISHKSATGAFV